MVYELKGLVTGSCGAWIAEQGRLLVLKIECRKPHKKCVNAAGINLKFTTTRTTMHPFPFLDFFLFSDASQTFLTLSIFSLSVF
jgi:hypothetical protein